jgi:catechol 2,3-dioxygenase-like lactoylglutathione lyase family enzyme
MKPRISVLTLGVADLKRSLKFYGDGLGLPTDGILGQEFDHGAVAFSKCRPAPVGGHRKYRVAISCSRRMNTHA